MREGSLYRERRALDWAATTLFYTALHLVQAYAFSIGERAIRTHLQHFAFVARDPVLQPIAATYEKLYQVSLSTRYRPRSAHGGAVGAVPCRLSAIAAALREEGVALQVEADVDAPGAEPQVSAEVQAPASE